MKSLFQKAKSEFRGHLVSPPPNARPPSHNQGPAPDEPSMISEPTAADIFRYRYHHGTNLGSIYVLERWLFPSMFPGDAPPQQSSELEAVKAWVERIGIDATRGKFEQHWANAVSDEDLVWLRNWAKCTSIRLPIGYFSLGPAFTDATPFSPYRSVYTNCWASILALIQRLRAHNIGVLLDLHALPGGANHQEHSGTNSGKAELWNRSRNRDLALRCCQFVASQVSQANLENVIGIQIVNEAEHNSPGMYQWYDSVISSISSIDASIPVYISDAWDLGQCIPYALSKNNFHSTIPTVPVAIDTHLYWCFSPSDTCKSPHELCASASRKLSELEGHAGSVVDRGAVQVAIGEYSCVLSEESWSKCGDASKEELVKRFGTAQSKRYQERTAGAFFWTWKMDWMPGGEWGFRAQTELSNIVPPASPTNVQALIGTARARYDELRNIAVSQHVQYWDNTCPGQHFEHDKYDHGWRVGFQDAMAFCQSDITGGNRIGALELWVLKRLRESGIKGDFVWEFEQGLRKGVTDFDVLSGY